MVFTDEDYKIYILVFAKYDDLPTFVVMVVNKIKPAKHTIQIFKIED